MPKTAKTALRRLALGTLLAGGVWLGLTACDGAAHADDTPSATATERPGGVLGAVADVVDQVVPKPSAKPEPDTEEPEPERSEEPEVADEPATEPRHGSDEDDEAPADEPTQEPDKPANPIGDILEDVADGVEQVTEPVKDVVEVITTPPAPVTPAPTTPAPATPPATATPTPEQTSTEQPARTDDAADDTVTTPAPAAPAPVDLPVGIGPVAGSATLLPGLTPAPVGTLAEPEPRAPVCGGHDHTDQPATGYSRGDGKQHRSRPNSGTSTQHPGKPCPTPASPDGQTLTALSVKPPPPTGEQLIAAHVGGAYSPPVLHRLTQLRARSAIPAGRDEHIEPGPA